tara:strand:- start:43012 stop:43254 length:243 start_codon:yes stop_codon:yes gene_type:complete
MRKNVQGSGDVFVNDKGWHRQNDAWDVHCCVSPPHPCHAGNLQRGSKSVFVNNKQAGRVNDPVNCGSAAMTGSGNVFAGG